jgi:hypothetical protein
MSAKKQMGMTISTTVQQQRIPRLLSLKFLRIMAPQIRDADLRAVNSMVCEVLSTPGPPARPTHAEQDLEQ